MIGAWAADAAGEDVLAAEYRPKAIALADEILPKTTDKDGEWAWAVRCQRAAFIRSLGRPAAAKLLLEGFPRRPNYSFDNCEASMATGREDRLARASAREADGLVELAGQLLKQHQVGQGAEKALLVALAGLGCVRGSAGLDLLKQAAGSEALEVRLMAAVSLIERGEKLGKDVLLVESGRRRQPVVLVPSLRRRFVQLMEKRDAPRLGKLSGPRDLNARWVPAALGRTGTPEGVEGYHKAAFDPESGIHTTEHPMATGLECKPPADVARRNHAFSVLGLAEIHCTDAVGAFLMARTDTIWYPEFRQRLRKVFAETPSQHARARMLVRNLLGRPSSLWDKEMMIDVAPLLNMPELWEAIARWGKSENVHLSEWAQHALAKHGPKSAERPESRPASPHPD